MSEHPDTGGGDVRTVVPAGYSPEEEWHGPYEVVRHADTGNYVVIDNAGRYAMTAQVTFGDRSAASASRDEIDRQRAARENARGVADRLFTTGMEILDPGGTEESRAAERTLERASGLLDTYGDAHLVAYDVDDRPYVRLEDADGSGWFAADYGDAHITIRHVAEEDTDVDRIEPAGSQPGSFFSPGGKRPGWTLNDLRAELAAWVAELGADYAASLPRVAAWQARHRH